MVERLAVGTRATYPWAMTQRNTTVLQILAQHPSRDAKEAADVSMIERFAQEHEHIFGKSNPLGHITGSALVIDERGRLLLTFHAKLPGYKAYYVQSPERLIIFLPLNNI